MSCQADIRRHRNRSAIRGRRAAVVLLLTTFGVWVQPGPASARPGGEKVVAGDVKVTHRGNLTKIRASDGSIINWHDGFDIERHETVRFVQPGKWATALNRDYSNDATLIAGQLKSNGRVIISNPYGVFVGNQARLNVFHLIAAAGNLSNEDFLAGQMRFEGITGDVINHGRIKADRVALLGRHVANHGQIVGAKESAIMVAGEQVWLGERGVPIRVGLGPLDLPTPAVENTGVIEAKRGHVRLSAGDMLGLAVRHSGSITARNIEIASPAGDVHVTGSLNARNQEQKFRGGSITVAGDRIALLGADLDASGTYGGGEIRIGANRNGEAIALGDTALTPASAVVIDEETSVRANAAKIGDGGEIVVWGTDLARVRGDLSVRGGSWGGNGGFVETSSRKTLDLPSAPDLAAPLGKAGEWLIDPANIVIRESTTPDILPVNDTEFYSVFAPTSDEPDPSVVDAGAVVDALAVGGSVTVTTEIADSIGDGLGTIEVASPLVIPNDPGLQSTAVLQLLAADTITIKEPIQNNDQDLILALVFIANDNFLMVETPDLIGLVGGQDEAGQQNSKENPNFQRGNLVIEQPIDTGVAGGPMLFGGVHIDVQAGASLTTHQDTVLLVGVNPVTDSTQPQGPGSVSVAAPIQTHGGIASLRSDGAVQLTAGSLDTEGGIAQFFTPTLNLAAPVDTGGGDLISLESEQITATSDIHTGGGALSFVTEGGNIDIQGAVKTEGGSVTLTSGFFAGISTDTSGNISVAGPAASIDTRLPSADEGEDTDLGGFLIANADSDITVDAEVHTGGGAINLVGLGDFVSGQSIDTRRDTLGSEGQTIAGTLTVRTGENAIIGGDITSLSMDIRAASTGTGSLTFENSPLIQSVQTEINEFDSATQGILLQAGIETGNEANVDAYLGTPRFAGASLSENPIRLSIVQDANMTDATLPDASQFGAQNANNLDYRLQSRGVDDSSGTNLNTGFVTLTTPSKFSGAELGILTGTGAAVDTTTPLNLESFALVVADSFVLEAPLAQAIDAPEIGIISGQDLTLAGNLTLATTGGRAGSLALGAGAESSGGNLSFGQNVKLVANQISLSAGSGTTNSSEVILETASGATQFQRNTDLDPDGYAFSIVQDSIIEDAALPDASAFLDASGNPIGSVDGIQYALVSQNAVVNLQTASKVKDTYLTLVGSNGVVLDETLTVRSMNLGSTQGFEVSETLMNRIRFTDPDQSIMSLQAGSSGFGDLTFGEASTGGGVTISAKTIELLAGPIFSGATNRIVFNAANSPTFTGSGDPTATGDTTSPDRFIFRQSGDIISTDLPDATYFGDGVGPNELFAVRSDGNNIALNNPTTLPGDATTKIVTSAAGVSFTSTDQDLDLGIRPIEIQTDYLSLVASGSITTTDPISGSALDQPVIVDASGIDFVSGFSPTEFDPDTRLDTRPFEFNVRQSGEVKGEQLPSKNAWGGGNGPSEILYSLNSTASGIDLSKTGDADHVEGSRLILQVDSPDHGIQLGSGFNLRSLDAKTEGDYVVNPGTGVQAEEYISLRAGCARTGDTTLCTNGGNLVLEKEIRLGAPFVELHAGTLSNFEGSNLKSTDFVSENEGWAVGTDGVILRTADGGESWLIQMSPAETDLFDVDFLDDQAGWAVGIQGVILQTLDGGREWSARDSGTTTLLEGVSFVSNDQGWVVGGSGTILTTTDGGQSWSQQTSGTGRALHATDFLDGDTGWAVGASGTILRTQDGGATWQQQSSPTNQDLLAVTFTDANTGWAAGTGGAIIVTNDGGITWGSQNTPAEVELASLSFLNENTGWVVGARDPISGTGTVFNTTDAGANWETQEPGTPFALAGVDFPSDQSGWAVGDVSTILHSEDGGNQWQLQSVGGIVKVSDDPTIQFEVAPSSTYSTTSFTVTQLGDAISSNLPTAEQFGGAGALNAIDNYALLVTRGAARIDQIENLRAAQLDIGAGTIDISGGSLGANELENTLLQGDFVTLEATDSDGQVTANVDTLNFFGREGLSNPISFSLIQNATVDPSDTIRNLPETSQFPAPINGLTYRVVSRSGDVVVDFPYFAPLVVGTALQLQAGDGGSVRIESSLSVQSLYVNADTSVANANLILSSEPVTVGQTTIPTVSSQTDQYYGGPVLVEENAELQAAGAIAFVDTVDAVTEGGASLKVGAGSGIQFGKDVGNTTRLNSFTATQATGVLNQPVVVFGNANSDDPVAVRTVGNIELLPDGYADGVPQTATIFKSLAREGSTGADEYDLLFDSTEGSFLMGEREKLSLPGILSIRAAGADSIARIGDLSGLEIYVDAANIQLQKRQPGRVLHANGSIGHDAGVDYVANIIEFTGDLSTVGNGRKPVFGIPDPYQLPGFFNGLMLYPTAAVNVNGSPANVAEFSNPDATSILDLQPLGASSADLAYAFWIPAPRPREPAPPALLVSDPAALLAIGIAAVPTTGAQYETRLAGAGVFDNVDSGVRLASAPVWVSEQRLLPAESQRAVNAFQRVLGPGLVNAPKIRDVLQEALNQYRSVTGARRVVGFEFRRYIKNRPNSQFAAYQALEELDSLFRNQRTSGLAPAEFQHVQVGWLTEILPEGITLDELSQAIFPSRYVRGSDILDVFGE